MPFFSWFVFFVFLNVSTHTKMRLTKIEKTTVPFKNIDISVPIELEFGLYPVFIFIIFLFEIIETSVQKQKDNETALSLYKTPQL